MNDVKMLDKKKHIDAASGFRLRYVKSSTEYFRPHCHNYFELCLMINGKCKHMINNTIQLLSEGYLLLIRDFDIHDYTGTGDNEFQFLNLSFEIDTLRGAFDYLGDGFNYGALLTAEYSPCVILSQHEKMKLFYSLMELNSIKDSRLAKTQMRALLLNIFIKYFQKYSEKESDIPLWLEILYEKMKKPENFIHGSERMLELSGKTREHLSRSMQKYYNITPTAYINELKLNYAINLMYSSNLSITDICYECGFSNISWFYKLFEREYGISPAKFKRSI